MSAQCEVKEEDEDDYYEDENDEEWENYGSDTSDSSSPALSEESEDEGSEFYKPGGYHPAHVGEVYNGRYQVVNKLGWGHYSTVWKVLDRVSRKVYAMKIVKSSKNYTRAALDEIKILKTITVNDPHDSKFCAHLIDSFKHTGPNGTRKAKKTIIIFIYSFRLFFTLYILLLLFLQRRLYGV